MNSFKKRFWVFRKSLVYAFKMYKNREQSDLFGVDKLESGNFNFYQRLKENILSHNNFEVIDVGANDGWFVKMISSLKSGIKITSFEPLKSQTGALEKLKSSIPDYKFILKAVGENKGRHIFNEYGTSGLSSMKSKLAGHYEVPTFSTEVINKYEVEVTTLDDELKSKNGPFLIKIDVQGSEMDVLKGCIDLFKENKIGALIVELCVTQKYEKQALAMEIISFLSDRGFEIFDINPFFYEPTTGQMTEFDALFVNKKVCKLNDGKK